jgi:predicted dehydrogenase
MKIVNIGVIGCANVVERHIVKGIRNIKNGRLIAIASRNSEKAREWADKFDCEYEKSYEDILKRKDIDAVYIPLPTGEHKKWVIKAAKAKKHVICEKSLSDSFDSVKEMVDSCRKNDIVLYEDFMCNCHPQHQKVLSLISNGKIGEVFLFRGFFGFPPLNKENFRYQKSLGGGSLNDAAAYPAFMSRKILKSEPLSVTSSLVYDKNHEVDIQGSAYLEFPKNKTALIAFGFNNMYQNNYSVWGSTGLINVNRAYSIPADMKPQVELVKQDLIKKIDIPNADHFSLIFEDFCSKVLEGKKLDYSPLISQARLMEALRISAKENRKVEVRDII